MPQPQASLIALGVLPFSLHSFNPMYAGPVAIHAKTEFSVKGKLRCYEEPFHAALYGMGFDTIESIPKRAIVGAGELHRVVRADYYRDIAQKYDERIVKFAGELLQNLFVWEWFDAFHLVKPLPIGGDTGLWDLPSSESRTVVDKLNEVRRTRQTFVNGRYINGADSDSEV
jgi:hypothetical protein